MARDSLSLPLCLKSNIDLPQNELNLVEIFFIIKDNFIHSPSLLKQGLRVYFNNVAISVSVFYFIKIATK